jgi:hypothetical protein
VTGNAKNLGTPDESIRFPGVSEDLVEIAGMTVARTVQDPGWRWSRDLQPLVGGEWCEARHIGVIISGRLGALRDGAVLEFGPDDVYDIPPGHDGYTIGEEPAVMIEWSGMRALAGTQGDFHDRILATLLFTDLVASTITPCRSVTTARNPYSTATTPQYPAAVRSFCGTVVKTTADGVLARRPPRWPPAGQSQHADGRLSDRHVTSTSDPP